MLVMLHPGWEHGEFRRTVRTADGQRLRQLVFRRGEPLDLVEEDDLVAVGPDLNRALVLILTPEPPQEGKPVPPRSGPKVDWSGTQEEAVKVAAAQEEERQLRVMAAQEAKAKKPR